MVVSRPRLLGAFLALGLGLPAASAPAASLELSPFASSAPDRLEYHVLLTGLTPTDEVWDVTFEIDFFHRQAWENALHNANQNPFIVNGASLLSSGCQGNWFCARGGGSNAGGTVNPNFDTDGAGGNDAIKLGELSLADDVDALLVLDGLTRYQIGPGIQLLFADNGGEVLVEVGSPPSPLPEPSLAALLALAALAGALRRRR